MKTLYKIEALDSKTLENVELFVVASNTVSALNKVNQYNKELQEIAIFILAREEKKKADESSLAVLLD